MRAVLPFHPPPIPASTCSQMLGLKRQFPISRFVSAILVLMVLALGRVRAGEAKPDWWEVQREVSEQLMDGKRDLVDLVKEMQASQPKTGREAMIHLNVALRSGMSKAAIKAVYQIRELSPQLSNYQVRSIYYQACENYEDWEFARRLLEVFEDVVTDVSIQERLIRHYVDSKWSVEMIDRWFAERPAGINGFWIKERVRFNVSHGRSKKLISELMNGVKRNPKDLQRAFLFLDALVYLNPRERPDLGWITGKLEPQRAKDAERLASRFRQLREWKAAVAFYRKAMATPLTEEEFRDHVSQRVMSDEQIKVVFSVRIREYLAKCLLELAENKEAQELMVQAADLRTKHNLGLNAFFAGEVQAASGARVIEKRIKDMEEDEKEDPGYWIKRAHYYRGRGEADAEEAAWKEALKLTVPKVEERKLKGPSDQRSMAVLGYVRFLKRMKRLNEALALLRTEMKERSVEAASAKAAVRELAFSFEKQLRVGDEVLWGWLERREAWESPEERLLWRMLEKADRGAVGKWFAQAEALCRESHPSRSLVLGWVMNRMGYPQRSIPLLEDAMIRAASKELKVGASFTLFESYLHVQDWRGAEKIFPLARQKLSVMEQVEWQSKIAIIAARMDAKEDAMRIWRARSNVNLAARLVYVKELANFGMRAELTDFYNERARVLPASDTPKLALKLLENL